MPYHATMMLKRELPTNPAPLSQVTSARVHLNGCVIQRRILFPWHLSSIFAYSIASNRFEIALKSIPKRIRLLICPIASIICLISIISMISSQERGFLMTSLRLFLLGSPRLERDGVLLEFDTSLEVGV